MSVVYKNTMKALGKYVPEKLQPFWNHPAGPQTIFFWAPAVKWGLVIAGLGDLQRPADKISIGQSSSLAVTGVIWTRYSLAITPKNWSLFSVNFFVACTALYQISRAIKYQREQAALNSQSSKSS
ncbi:mitochondrial pyruvate carrier 2-like isoform X1 [Vespa mandarinia]|uniref:mitochondrial pyruvate carrier 2-like isoform X1 n=1 Tax=Vespa mandarinia TaxID=7446 RepID=UPI00162087E8|nr:mitochondrial pyruvate carrier 2-like isoform X1 [Vespa mandarinia]